MKPQSLMVALALLAPAGPALAQRPASKHVQASLLSEVESVQPGHPFWVGIHLKMAPGWHTYWKNPADSGLPTRMAWRLPDGFRAGPLQWPLPSRLAAPPLMSYGYEGEVLLPVEIAPPAALSPAAPVLLAGRVDWLECQEACIPGRAELELTMPVRTETPKPAPSAALFAETRRSLPAPARGWGFKAVVAPGVLALSFRAPRAQSRAYFFSDRPLVVDYPAPQTLRSLPSGQRLDIPRAPNGPAPDRLTGVLMVEEGAVPLAMEVDVPVSPVAALPPARTGAVGGGAPGIGPAAAPRGPASSLTLTNRHMKETTP